MDMRNAVMGSARHSCYVAQITKGPLKALSSTSCTVPSGIDAHGLHVAGVCDALLALLGRHLLQLLRNTRRLCMNDKSVYFGSSCLDHPAVSTHLPGQHAFYQNLTLAAEEPSRCKGSYSG